MADSERATRRLRVDELRYAQRAGLALDQLTAQGIAADPRVVLGYEETLATWGPFIDRCAHGEASRLRLPGDARARVQDMLDAEAAATTGLTAVCFWLVDSAPVAISVHVPDVLRRATLSVVSRQRDLMLATPDSSSGLCVELNHEPLGDFYDLTTWGGFRLGQSSASVGEGWT